MAHDLEEQFTVPVTDTDNKPFLLNCLPYINVSGYISHTEAVNGGFTGICCTAWGALQHEWSFRGKTQSYYPGVRNGRRLVTDRAPPND